MGFFDNDEDPGQWRVGKIVSYVDVPRFNPFTGAVLALPDGTALYMRAFTVECTDGVERVLYRAVIPDRGRWN